MFSEFDWCGGLEGSESVCEPETAGELVVELVAMGMDRAIEELNRLSNDERPRGLWGVTIGWNQIEEVILATPLVRGEDVEKAVTSGLMDWEEEGRVAGNPGGGRVNWWALVDRDEGGEEVLCRAQLYYVECGMQGSGGTVTGVFEVRRGGQGAECQFYVLSGEEVERPRLLMDGNKRRFRDAVVVNSVDGGLRTLRFGGGEDGFLVVDDYFYRDCWDGKRVKRRVVLVREKEMVRVSVVEGGDGWEARAVSVFEDVGGLMFEVMVFGVEEGGMSVEELLEGASVAGFEGKVEGWEGKVWLWWEGDGQRWWVDRFVVGDYVLEFPREIEWPLWVGDCLLVVGWVPGEVAEKVSRLPGCPVELERVAAVGAAGLWGGFGLELEDKEGGRLMAGLPRRVREPEVNSGGWRVVVVLDGLLAEVEWSAAPERDGRWS